MADCRDLWGPILGRQLLELTRHAVEEIAERDAHNYVTKYYPRTILA